MGAVVSSVSLWNWFCVVPVHSLNFYFLIHSGFVVGTHLDASPILHSFIYTFIFLSVALSLTLHHSPNMLFTFWLTHCSFLLLELLFFVSFLAQTRQQKKTERRIKKELSDLVVYFQCVNFDIKRRCHNEISSFSEHRMMRHIQDSPQALLDFHRVSMG